MVFNVGEYQFLSKMEVNVFIYKPKQDYSMATVFLNGFKILGCITAVAAAQVKLHYSSLLKFIMS